MKNEFVLAFNELLEERGLSRDVILGALESAMVSAYRRSVNASSAQHVEARIDSDTGRIAIYAEKEVVDYITDERTEVLLDQARLVDPNCEINDMVLVESTPDDFGRVAAQTARQVIQQRMRDAERYDQMKYFEDQVGEIVSGVVQAVNASGLTVGLEKHAEGGLSRKDLIPGERFRIHDRVRALIAEVKDNPRGPQIILSRTHSNFLRRLLENEVPEIYHGIVEIRSIAREPGHRAKVAVVATQPGIDPVGACVGMRGVRIQTIVRELHNEKIDVIEWNEDPREFIAKAISPAKVVGVYLTEKNEKSRTATVVVKEDQLSLAIGRDGQNARLAARLTGWRIDIKSLSEASSDLIYRLEQEEAFAEILTSESTQVDAVREVLAKKADNLALVGEDYARMIKFVDTIEKKIFDVLHPKYTPEQEARLAEVRKSLPQSAFKQHILDSELPEHVQYALQEAGYESTGQVLVDFLFDPEKIMAIKGMGPRAQASMDGLAAKFLNPPVPEVVEAPVVETAAVEEAVVAEAPIAAEPEAVEAEAAAEQPVDAVVETVLPEAEVVEEAASEPEEELDFEEIFEVSLEQISFDENFEERDEDDDSDDGDKKRRGKKGRKNVKLEFDPDRGETVVKRKHKRGDNDWGEWDEF
ncbi:MAG: transcription termination/antitermination protein NusA [Anaerolineae bacterium]|nr:transcription termination/antitermination protein NusA [Anaerolineae bacterium]